MGSLYSWEFLGIPRNSKSSQNWSLPFPEILSNSKLFKSELICKVGNFWEFLGIPGNSQKTGNSFCKGHLHNWEFLRIPRNFQNLRCSLNVTVSMVITWWLNNIWLICTLTWVVSSSILIPSKVIASVTFSLCCPFFFDWA